MKTVALSILLFAVPLFAVPSEDSARFTESGSAYLSVCGHAKAASEARVSCAVWTSGVIDGFVAYNKALDKPLLNLPDGITTLQVEMMTIKYMRDNPDKLHFRASELIFLSLSNAYAVKR